MLGVTPPDDDEEIEVEFEGIYPENWQGWIAFLDADDQWLSEPMGMDRGRRLGLRAEALWAVIDHHPDIDPDDRHDAFRAAKYLAAVCVRHWLNR